MRLHISVPPPRCACGVPLRFLWCASTLPSPYACCTPRIYFSLYASTPPRQRACNPPPYLLTSVSLRLRCATRPPEIQLSTGSHMYVYNPPSYVHTLCLSTSTIPPDLQTSRRPTLFHLHVHMPAARHLTSKLLSVQTSRLPDLLDFQTSKPLCFHVYRHAVHIQTSIRPYPHTRSIQI